MQLYYLVVNRNGFEEPLQVGGEKELLFEQRRLEEEEGLSPEGERKPLWDVARYYLTSKRDWDVQHCPLIPVDLS